MKLFQAILALMAVACGIADSLLEQEMYPLGAPWLYGDNRPDDNPKINGLITWAFALITWVTRYLDSEACLHSL